MEKDKQQFEERKRPKQFNATEMERIDTDTEMDREDTDVFIDFDDLAAQKIKTTRRAESLEHISVVKSCTVGSENWN
jgi:hypothetical protein